MLWLFFAFIGPICWAMSVHLDKYLIERYFKNSSVIVMMVFTSVVAALMMPLIWYFYPAVLDMPARDAVLVAAIGLLDSVALLFYMRALQTEEASDVAPFFQTIPLFGFVLAYLLLGETLNAWQGLGAALIIAGGLSLSLRRRAGGSRLNMSLIALMFACCLVFAFNSVAFKLFALRDDFWTTVFWQGAGQVAFGVIAMFMAKERRHFLMMLKTNTVPVLAVNATNEVVYLAGNLGAGYALLLAPVTLVQAVSSTTTMFVFIFGIILTVFFPRLGRENLSLRNLLRKGAAILVVAIGAYLVGGGSY
jgi:uncharacterized membrane protein